MRTLLLSSLLATFAFACTTTTTVEKPSSGTSSSGGDNTNTTGSNNTTGAATDTDGEHGSNAPAGSTNPPPAAGTTVDSDNWSGTKAITDNITIDVGQTVTIAPGTVVTMGPNVAITIKGTLKVDAADNHVKMTGDSAWQGLIVASGGTLDADGLEIDNATDALWTQAGNTAATFKDGVVSAATPFKMEAGSTLTFDHSSATAVSAGSLIAGTFVATFMTYDKGANGGLTLDDAAGTMSITDSTLKGSGGGDFVISDAGSKVTVAYTTITGSHCGFHFGAVDSFVIDHVSDQGNSYGAMLYGSKNGGSITASNFRANTTTDIDFTKSANGTVTIDGSFMTTTGGIKATNAQTMPIATAQPRTGT